jgi:hypothetical protein
MGQLDSGGGKAMKQLGCGGKLEHLGCGEVRQWDI